MKKSLVSLNSFHLIRLTLVLALLFFTSLSPLIYGVSTQQQNPSQPLTLQELNNKMLRQSVGRNMTDSLLELQGSSVLRPKPSLNRRAGNV